MTTDYEARIAELLSEYENAGIASEEECEATNKLFVLASDLSRSLSSEKARREGLEHFYRKVCDELDNDEPLGSLLHVCIEAREELDSATVPEIAEGAKDACQVARSPGCQCHWEEGDSPCPVHGEHEELPPANLETTK